MKRYKRFQTDHKNRELTKKKDEEVKKGILSLTEFQRSRFVNINH